MEKLKPCPFCGNHEEDDPYVLEVAPTVFRVECCECRTVGPIASTADYAAYFWNTRQEEEK